MRNPVRFGAPVWFGAMGRLSVLVLGLVAVAAEQEGEPEQVVGASAHELVEVAVH